MYTPVIQNISDDHQIFMNKQDFKELNHQSPVNSKFQNKKRMQNTIYHNTRSNSNPNAAIIAFTPFMLESQANQQQSSSRKNEQSSTLYPSFRQDVNKITSTKQRAIQQNINRQIHLRKGAQFRNITLDKISQNFSQNIESEILKVTQKKINSQNLYIDQLDSISGCQIINPSLIVSNRKRAPSNISQQNKSMSISQYEYPESPLGGSKLSSHFNDENTNNIQFISTDSSTHVTHRKKKKNFSIQPTLNVSHLNTLYENLFQPKSFDTQNNNKYQDYKKDLNNSKVFQRYSESKQYVFTDKIPLSAQNSNTYRKNEQGLNKYCNIPSPLIKHKEDSSLGDYINYQTGYPIPYPQNSIQQQKRRIINYVSSQHNHQYTVLKDINQENTFYDNSKCLQRSLDEKLPQNQNEFLSHQQSPIANPIALLQSACGFQTLKQRAVTPKDTLARTKYTNKQNIQDIYLTFKREKYEVSNEQQTSLKTEIIKKLKKDSLKKQQQQYMNSRGFPYQIQFDSKAQKQLENYYHGDNERLESWGVDYRQDTAFGLDTHHTQDNEK